MHASSDSRTVNFKDQVMVITGGGRGLGQAFAFSLASLGATINIVARSSEQLGETVSLIKANGGRAYAYPVDVTDRAAVENTVRQIHREFGSVDLLVNNAATMLPLGPIHDVDPDEWWRCMDVNLRGPFLFIRALLPGMIKHRRGRIINVSSSAGIMDISHLSAYIVSKCALIRLTQSLAAETREYGISAFAVSPGAVQTAMTKHVLESKEGKKWLPWFKEFYDSHGESPERATDLIVQLASGKADLLSGCFIEHSDNLDELVTQAEKIKRNKMHTLKVEKLR